MADIAYTDNRWEREASLRLINKRPRKAYKRYTIFKILMMMMLLIIHKTHSCVNDKYEPIARIKDGDAVICFNFRTDRCREITTALTQEDKSEFDMHSLDLHFTTMTMYDKNFKNVNVIFEKDNLNNTLGQVIADNGLKQIRIAETEKYPHVTFSLVVNRI